MLRLHALLFGLGEWPALLALVAATTGVGAQSPAAGGRVDFDRDIRPILSNHCFQCHGPDSEQRKASLRLDQREDAFADRDGGAVIVAGDASSSLLIERILHADADEVMPPIAASKPLDDAQKRLLVRWIEAGADWSEHWSFVAPVEPPVPEVAESVWAQGAIDRFILASLDRVGLQPNELADRRTLLRRVSLDLTGLPPTPGELRAFLADESPDAYERVVDRMLRSDAYGEHMARFWLDAARYGDTHGLHLDNYREMWPYRDWVVRAFRDNLPYDRFIVEQLAGDLLPDPSRDQLIASGFNRCHITTSEGGSIAEEVYVRNVIDRVSTAGTVFLGLSVGCAVCHDHKFDPISQREFYQLFAFFNNMDGNPLDGNKKDPAPVLKVATAEQVAGLSQVDASRADVERRIQAALREVDYAEPAPRDQEGDDASTRREVVWIDDELPSGAVVEGVALKWEEADALVQSGRRSICRKSQGNQQTFFRTADHKLRIASGDTLFAWVYLDPADLPEEIMLQWNSDGLNGWLHRAYWGANKIAYGKDQTTERWRLGDLPKAGQWTRLEIPVAAVGLRPGMAVHGMALTQFGGTSYWDAIGIETSSRQGPEDFVWIDDEAPRGSQLSGDGRKWQWSQGEDERQPDPFSGARSLRRAGKGLSQDFFNNAAVPLRVQHGDRLFAHVWLDPKDPPRSVQLQFYANGSWDHRARWGIGAHGQGRPNGADFVAGEIPELGKWVRLEVGISDCNLAPGDAITGWAFTQVDGAVYWDAAGVRTFGLPNDDHLRSLMAWEAMAQNDASVPADIREALKVSRDVQTEPQRAAIRGYYLRYVHEDSRPIFAPLAAELAEIDKQKKGIEGKVPTTLVMKERVKPKAAFLLKRGQYDQKGEQVVRATPAALPPMAPGLPRDRLGFARWLISPEQPLTARVTVNRFWQQLFGVGLVKTSEDFGNQGERPTHPELLDYLATRFVKSGWDVRQLMKQMVMSSAYRQEATVRPDALRRDPDNRWLARGPRFRLDGETLRDQALHLSGLLVQVLGGPGVRPPQPAGLWKAVGYSSSNTARFKADTAHEQVHRRSLYTFWKRTAPPPQMTTFDAPSREECRVRRERTNTPLQALLLMNDPQYVEAARGFAQRILSEGGEGDVPRIRWALTCATCQVPSAGDVDDVKSLLTAERAAFLADSAAAKRLVEVGVAKPTADVAVEELAAWTMVANLILNLDVVLTKD